MNTGFEKSWAWPVLIGSGPAPRGPSRKDSIPQPAKSGGDHKIGLPSRVAAAKYRSRSLEWTANRILRSKASGRHLTLVTRGVLPPPSRRKAGVHGAMGTGRSLSSGRPKAGPVGRCGKALGVIRQNCSASSAPT